METQFNKNIYTMNGMNLGKRIELRLSELGWERNDLLSKVPELSPQSLSALITRDSKRTEHDVAIAAALGVNLAWLNSGLGKKLAGNDHADEETTIVRLSTLAKDSCLACILPVHKGLAVNKSWMNTVFSDVARTDDLCVLPVTGLNMAPSFGAGDLLLVDQGAKRLGDDGVYIVGMAGSAQIKRLQARPDGSILMINDNPQYEPAIIPPENLDKITILGRALFVWSGRRL